VVKYVESSGFIRLLPLFSSWNCPPTSFTTHEHVQNAFLAEHKTVSAVYGKGNYGKPLQTTANQIGQISIGNVPK
jgi:hypothetical protein